jgi:hypothetical protein
VHLAGDGRWAGAVCGLTSAAPPGARRPMTER